MIRYSISEAEIRCRVAERIPATLNRDGTLRQGGRRSWLDRAAERTEQLRKAGSYNDSDGEEFWPEVKEIFAEIQHGKCAFCETQLMDRKGGKKDGDVEHFRPKRPGPAWPERTTKANDMPVEYPSGIVTGGPHFGYYLLAYCLVNYLLACRTCNQDYKRAYFPIMGSRIIEGDTHTDYADEQHLLIHPLIDEEDPETLIQFSGIIADPIADRETDPTNYWRARVIIDFFDLNGRDDLRRERMEVIEAVYCALTHPDNQIATIILANLLSESSRHTNCARSFERLFRTYPEQAIALGEEIIARRGKSDGSS